MYTIQMVWTTPYSEGYVFGTECGNGGYNIHSKDREMSEEPLIAQIHLKGQSEVIPSQ